MLNPLEPEFLNRIGRMRPIDADMERGLCICLSARQAAHGNPAETAEPIDIPFGRTSSCGPNKPRIARGGSFRSEMLLGYRKFYLPRRATS